jgi:KipI family sensor histidine kinase inhibitor
VDSIKRDNNRDRFYNELNDPNDQNHLNHFCEMIYDKPKFKTMGDRALLVEVGDEIAADVNEGVRVLLYGLLGRGIHGVLDLVPGYHSLMVVFDPLLLDRKELQSTIADFWDRKDQMALPENREYEIPVVYGGEHGPDLDWVAGYHHLPVETVVEMHSAVRYRVYMIGFTPGYPYMGELPAELSTPRRDTPRTHVPGGSVGIAQRQTGIYPVASPGGWQIIGWTPVKLFDAEADPPSHLQMGDRVRFKPVGAEELS